MPRVFIASSPRMNSSLLMSPEPSSSNRCIVAARSAAVSSRLVLCACVHMWACGHMWACVHVGAWGHICACGHVRACVHICACGRVGVWACVHICVYLQRCHELGHVDGTVSLRVEHHKERRCHLHVHMGPACAHAGGTYMCILKSADATCMHMAHGTNMGHACAGGPASMARGGLRTHACAHACMWRPL